MYHVLSINLFLYIFSCIGVGTNLYSNIVLTFNWNPFSLNSLVFLVRSARMSSSQSTWIFLNSYAKQMIIALCTACMLWLSIMMLWIQPSLGIMHVMWRILRGRGTESSFDQFCQHEHVQPTDSINLVTWSGKKKQHNGEWSAGDLHVARVQHKGKL